MAKNARMLHLKISRSLQVDSLPLAARLLFTWMIAHADDDGRLKGEPKYIKGCVVPFTNWSVSKVKTYLDSMKDAGLIHYWEQNNEWFIELIKWNKYQTIRADRYIVSDLPSFQSQNDNQLSTIGQPIDNQPTAQVNINKTNSTKINSNHTNKSESKGAQPIAVKNIATYKGSISRGVGSYPNSEETSNTGKDSSNNSHRGISPKTFDPQSNEELQALETWKRLEPDNLFAFYPTYLSAVKKGLPAHKFGEFASEIEQDPSIKNRGSVFNKKVSDYIESQNINKGGENI